MTKRFLAVIALVLATCAPPLTPLLAQTKKIPPPKAAPCDTAGQLARSPEISGALRATLNKTCGSYQILLSRYLDSSWTGAQLLAYVLHGKPPFLPPKDTVIAPPVIVPPKDSTPAPVLPKDTAVVTPPAGALVNAHPMGPLTAPFVVVPKGWTGRAFADLKSGGGCQQATACVTGEGAVRILTNLAKMAFDDPIVYPNQPGASHLHQFFGDSRISAFSTGDSLRANCSSTNSGGTLNCTTYWTPAMVSANGEIVPPVDWPDKNGGATIYYKDGYEMDASVITPAPNGLKMIAGDKTWSNTKQNQEHVWWTCADGPGPAFSPTIHDCVGRVELIVIFPQCWDGVNLDSPDHKSHMSYPIYANVANGSKCPAKYPVAIPEITELFYWRVPTGVKSSTWHISSDMDLSKPGGLSAHADWLMGWDPATMKKLVTQCLNPSKDSGTNGLCDNTYLNPPP
jgi:hypothetical protein